MLKGGGGGRRVEAGRDAKFDGGAGWRFNRAPSYGACENPLMIISGVHGHVPRENF